jgi:hypothetical protein
MRIAAQAIVVSACVAGLTATALAAEMTGAQIKAFLGGNTVYLQTTAASVSGHAGQGVIYWAKDGTALYKTPNGTMMHGTWHIKGNTICPNWKEKPGTGCVRYDKTGGTVTVLDAVNGKVRAKIVKTVAGNALSP